MAVLQWMAQWKAEDHRQCRSGTMGGWTAAAIMMDGSSKIVMDCGSSDVQQRHVIFLNNEWTGVVEVKHPLVCGWLG
jgi:hypothetical protein